MPKLDARLQAVADQIHGGVHVDVGSDHGYLLKELLLTGKIDRGIAIENKPHPAENSRRSLAGLDAEIRLADALKGLQTGEADSVSFSGMGGELIARLLEASPDRIPPIVVTQPNRRPEAVRRWGLANDFHLVDEQWTEGRIRYLVMRLERKVSTPDPAYIAIDRESAELFGPLLIKRRQPEFRKILMEEQQYLMGLQGRTVYSQNRLDRLTTILSDW